jgi:hypothetical protein
MPLYLTLDEVLRMHELLINKFGGAPGVRDPGLITSALRFVGKHGDESRLHRR